MAGKMIDEILKAEKRSEEKIVSAQKQSDEILSSAKEKSDEIIASYKQKAYQHAEELSKKSEEKLNEYKSDERLKTKDDTVQILFSARKKQNEAVKAVIKYLSE